MFAGKEVAEWQRSRLRTFWSRVRIPVGKMWWGAAADDSRPTRTRTADQKIAVGCVTIRPRVDVTAVCLPTTGSLLSENF